MKQGHYHNAQLENFTKNITTFLDSATNFDYAIVGLFVLRIYAEKTPKTMYGIRKIIKTDASQANLYETERSG